MIQLFVVLYVVKYLKLILLESDEPRKSMNRREVHTLTYNRGLIIVYSNSYEFVFCHTDFDNLHTIFVNAKKKDIANTINPVR